MGGWIVLRGNINPLNILTGTPESVFEESMEALRTFGRGSGGYILSDGANIPPGAPVENINTMMQAARQFNSATQR